MISDACMMQVSPEAAPAVSRRRRLQKAARQPVDREAGLGLVRSRHLHHRHLHAQAAVGHVSFMHNSPRCRNSAALNITELRRLAPLHQQRVSGWVLVTSWVGVGDVMMGVGDVMGGCW